MADKNSASDKLPQDDKWQMDLKPTKTPKIKGRVILIIPNKRIILEYGSGLGTEIPYNVEKHKNLKTGDILEI